MLEGKKKGLSIFVERTPLVGDVAVCLSFKAKVNTCALNKLKGPGVSCCNLVQVLEGQNDCPEHAFPQGSEEACLCYALYLTVNNALCGDPLATARSKVGAVHCCSHDGYFCISYTTKGTASAVRKSLGIALRNLGPGKVFSVYAHCVRSLGGKPKREYFNYVADEITKSIDNEVSCGLIGNIRIVDKEVKQENGSTKKLSAKEQLENMLDVLVNKLNPGSVKGSKQKPADHTECDHSNVTELKVSGWGAFAVRDYVSAKVKGLSAVVGSKSVIVSVKPKQWETLASKLKKYTKDYVANKYAKVGDELPAIMGYLMLTTGSVCCGDARDVIKNKVKSSEVEKAINSAL